MQEHREYYSHVPFLRNLSDHNQIRMEFKSKHFETFMVIWHCHDIQAQESFL